MSREKSDRIGLGLAILAATTCPPHTCEEIAAYCDCTRQNISRIEVRALRKIRAALHRDKLMNLSLEAEFQGLLHKNATHASKRLSAPLSV